MHYAQSLECSYMMGSIIMWDELIGQAHNSFSHGLVLRNCYLPIAHLAWCRIICFCLMVNVFEHPKSISMTKMARVAMAGSGLELVLTSCHGPVDFLQASLLSSVGALLQVLHWIVVFLSRSKKHARQRCCCLVKWWRWWWWWYCWARLLMWFAPPGKPSLAKMLPLRAALKSGSLVFFPSSSACSPTTPARPQVIQMASLGAPPRPSLGSTSVETGGTVMKLAMISA